MSDYLDNSPETTAYDPLYDNEVMEKQDSLAVSNESLPNRLRRQLLASQKETARLKRLIELLNDNPATNEILQLLGRKY